MNQAQSRLAPLRNFVVAMTELVQSGADERKSLATGRRLLEPLLQDDAWLLPPWSKPRSDSYSQYLLHCDPLQRFSVVSFVWGPGQATPVHNHGVWGLVGMLRGTERCEEYPLRDGHPSFSGREHLMQPGQIEAVSPTLGDWHRVANALPDRPSISIHVYGGNIGAVRRQRLDDDGKLVEFVSGYTPADLPNLWG